MGAQAVGAARLAGSVQGRARPAAACAACPQAKDEEESVMKRRRLRTGEIPEDIMEEILQGIGRMANGETVLVAQDGILVQVEIGRAHV